MGRVHRPDYQDIEWVCPYCRRTQKHTADDQRRGREIPEACAICLREGLVPVKAKTAEELAEERAKSEYWTSVRASHGLRYGGGGESLRQRATREDRESDSPADDEVQS